MNGLNGFLNPVGMAGMAIQQVTEVQTCGPNLDTSQAGIVRHFLPTNLLNSAQIKLFADRSALISRTNSSLSTIVDHFFRRPT